jgi:hypothetical protein
MASSPQSVIHPVAAGGEKAVRSDTFEALARAGFLARGVVYAIIGLLAIKLAVGAGGKTTDQRGALKTVAEQPFGKVLLILLAIGLAGYALWRLVHAALGHGPERNDSGLDRVTALCSGVVYAGLCALAVMILLGSGGGGSTSPDKATGGVLGWSGGTWLVGLAGLVMIGVGAYQGYRGVTHDFLRDSKSEQMGSATRTSVKWIGTFGLLARMVVFVLVGVFLIKAAVEYDPSEAVGIDGALAKLADSPQGPLLLGVVAAGLIAFAVYSFSDARYRRI